MDAWLILAWTVAAALAAALFWALRDTRERSARTEAVERRNAWLERRAVQWRDEERRLFDHGPVVLLQLDAAAPHVVRGASANLHRALGGGASAGGQPFASLLHPDDAQPFEAVAAQARAGELAQRELRLWHDGGSWRWYLGQFVLDASDDTAALRGYLVGIDALKQAESQAAARRRDLEALVQKMSASARFLQGLQQLGEQLQQCDDEAQAAALLAGGVPELLDGWDGALSFADDDERMQFAAQWGAYPPPGREGARAREGDCWALRRGRLHHCSIGASGRDRAPVCSHLSERGALPDGITHALCVPLLTPGGRPGALHFATRATLDAEQVRAAGWAAETLADTVKLALANLQLRLSLQEQATRDWLTGLYNRRHFDEALRSEVARAQRSGDRLTLALLDIDHFKSFNDAFGHEAGDEVLRAVAGELRRFVRSSDLACRIGGEELALLLPRAATDEAFARLDRLRDGIGRLELRHEGVVLPRVTVSIGIADLEQGDAAHLMNRADVALYAAKHAGRNRLERWRAELQADADDAQAVAESPAQAAVVQRKRLRDAE